MVLISEIEKSFLEQNRPENFQKPYIKRDYFDTTNAAKGNHIEVIAGIRRCGKSTLMHQILAECTKKVAFFNFEDSRIFGFDVEDFGKLDEIIGNDTEVYFFDEIQNVKAWEIFARQLHDRGKKLFITGSNASLLSKDLGTRLTGRHLQHELFPFNYTEFLRYKNLENSTENLEKYINIGGFPEYISSENIEMPQNLLRDILFRDIAIRYGIKNTSALMDMALYLISNVAKEFTFNSLKKIFNIGSANTVSDYLNWMEDAYLFFYLPKFSWSSKNSAVNPRKVYSIDTGLANANSLSFSEDNGRLLENTVFLYLRQHFLKIYYFKEKKECDFVVFDKKNTIQVIQVCEKVHLDNKKRELEGLLEAMLFFKLEKGVIITKNQKDKITMEGKTIELIPLSNFLLEK